VKKIFIGGCARSGTTMIGSMLGAAIDGICTPESQFISNAFKKHPKIMTDDIETTTILSLWDQDLRFRLWRIDLSEFKQLLCQNAICYSELIENLILFYCKQKGRSRPLYWVDHTPMNLKNSSILFKLFPNARIIHIIRDGRAVAASMLKTIWAPKTIHTAARYWLEDLAHSFSAEIYWGNEKILKVKYEDILQNPESNLKKLCAFCGIKFYSSMLEGGNFKSPILTSNQHRLVGSPPDQTRILSWQKELNSRQIEIFESLAGDVLNYLGYKTIYWPHTTPLRGIERYMLDIKEFIHREFINRWKMYIRFRRELSNKASATVESNN
jgi:hypothetical protein